MFKFMHYILAATMLLGTVVPLTASAAPHQFTIRNGASSAAVTSVEISPTTDENWESNLLNANETIAAGASRTFTIPGDCQEDVRITFADREQVVYSHPESSDDTDSSINTCTQSSLAVASAPAAGPVHSFTVQNAGSDPITTVEISPPSSPQWGQNWLAPNTTIAAGQRQSFTIDRGCTEDVRISYGDNRHEYRGYDTCQNSTLQATPSSDSGSSSTMAPSSGGHPLTLDNETAVAIEYVQISPTTDDNWGSDWLGPTEVIRPGTIRTFAVSGACMEDIRVTFMDQHTREWHSVNTCQQAKLRVDAESIRYT